MFVVGAIDRNRLRKPLDLRTATRPWQQNLKLAPKDRRTSADGIVHASRGEMKRWVELRLLERAHEISDLRRQVRFELRDPNRPDAPAIKTPTGKVATWTCDFTYREKGQLVVEDFKSFWTRETSLRIATFESLYGVKVRITGAARRAR